MRAASSTSHLDLVACHGYNRNGGRGDQMRLTIGAGCRCIHRVSIWPALYTCDDSRAQYLACNSLILRKQN
jgi:hypothetical protein